MSPVITECSKRPPPFWWDPVFIVLSEDRVHKVLGRDEGATRTRVTLGGRSMRRDQPVYFGIENVRKLGTWNQERGQNGFSEAGTNQGEG